MSIFISYRRTDAGGHAGRLCDRLKEKFGPSNVFFDVDDIKPGQDFVETLYEKLGKTKVMLVVIDQSWVTVSDDRGRRRIDDPTDFVHIEVATAIKKDITIMPVLVGSGTMPSIADLPSSLAPLATRQAFPVRHESFRQDVDRLAESIREHVKRSDLQTIIEAAQDISQIDNRILIYGLDQDSSYLLFFGSDISQNTPWKSHLLKDAIVKLIVGADVSSSRMKQDDELQGDEFWKAILKAIAESYRADHPNPAGYTDAELIRELLEQLS